MNNSRMLHYLLLLITGSISILLISSYLFKFIRFNAPAEMIGFTTGLFAIWFLDLSRKSIISKEVKSEIDITFKRILEINKIELIEKQIIGETFSNVYVNTNARNLINSDPNLAAAQIRIQLEKNLNYLAEHYGISSSRRFIPLSKIISSLSEKEILPKQLAISLRDVINVCNRAVHGQPIPKEQIADVVDVSERLITMLIHLRKNPPLLDNVDNRIQSVKNIYLSYTHKDSFIIEHFLKHFEPYEKKEALKLWHDKNLSPGSDWSNELQSNLLKSDIVLLFISADYLSSVYCMEEMQRAIEKAEDGNGVVIPILISPSNWRNEPVSRFQVLPRDTITVTEHEDQEKVWKEIVQEIVYSTKQRDLRKALK